MAEDTAARQTPGFWRRAGQWLGWLARMLLGLAWTAAYVLLRLLEGSKRVTACQAFLTTTCLVIVWVLLALRDLPLWAILGLLIGVIWASSSEGAWEELQARMEFIAEAHPDTRLLHADGELRRLVSLGPLTWRFVARAVLGVLLAVILYTGWHEMSLNLRAMVVSFVAAFAGIIFIAIGWAFWKIEQRLQVQFYIKGWRLAEPEYLETMALARWPRLAGVLGWRPAITGRLGGLATAIQPWLQPWGVCAE